jgi:hypothetical protein
LHQVGEFAIVGNCALAKCPGFTYKEVPLEAALIATLKTNDEFARELGKIFGYTRRELVKPKGIL